MPDDKTFIETQFPVSKLSKESYKERKANYSQTLTGIGKWWGRKPLVLVRAIILGLLLPATDNPQKDREIFLKLMTMDDDGLWRRKSKSIPLRELFASLSPKERKKWFNPESDSAHPKYIKGITREEKMELQKTIFNSMSYDEKLTYCNRPEQIDGPSEKTWEEINSYFNTNTSLLLHDNNPLLVQVSDLNLAALVQELGKRRFGHIPRVGDAFCGGGSVPFEAARLGCEAFGSDLNPVASLLTWASLNIIGGGEDVAKQVRKAQETVFNEVDRQITEWEIENNNKGWRADAYLYCNETVCPECDWMIPLAPSWVIGEKTYTIASLIPDKKNKRFKIEIHEGVSESAMSTAKETGTVKNSRLECPNPDCIKSTPISAIRGDRKITKRVNGREIKETIYGLRPWENEDIVPRPDDVFQERLYCIRWVETYIDHDDNEKPRRHYRTPDKEDLKREEKVLNLLKERFAEWQEKGFIPDRKIEPGDKTDEPIRTRGWTHWHHLFNPRQLFIIGLILKTVNEKVNKSQLKVACLLGLGKCTDWNSRLSVWDSSAGNERVANTFLNQAFNPILNYGMRGIIGIANSWFWKINNKCKVQNYLVLSNDARQIINNCNYWITDPPYADAINYHELSEYFLALYRKNIAKLFPDWYTDSKRALAITGTGAEFRKSMVDSYRNLANHMPANGMQVVMFTHQDASVWADLALILWASGLHVTAAWTIATETESALKEGNYVQGTVLMILRKQTSDETAFLDEISYQVEEEVEKQLKSMLDLDDDEEPNFSDSDYQLAAYAAALRVLTQYKGIGDIDIAYELSRERSKGEKSPIEVIIGNAVKTASNYLVPKALKDYIWKGLTPEEKFYIKGLEVESHGEFRSGVYQEFARGFGVREYKYMLQSGKANKTLLKTASELKRRELGGQEFGSSIVRNALFAVYRVSETEETRDGLTWLKTEVSNYWQNRETLIAILRYLSSLSINHWRKDSEAARLLAGAVENDHV